MVEDAELQQMLDEHYGSGRHVCLLLHPDDARLTIWYWIVLLATMYASFYAPTNLCFYQDYKDIDTVFQFRDSVIEVVFLLDICVNFNTALLRGTTYDKELVVDRWTIALCYIQGWFFLDIISSIPFGYEIDRAK